MQLLVILCLVGQKFKISIVPRGMSALGYTLQLPTEERFLNSKDELKGQIATLLGGRSAEEVVLEKLQLELQMTFKEQPILQNRW